MVEISYYVAAGSQEPFAEWFAELDPVASAKIARAIARMEQGNFSNVKSVGEGCWNPRPTSPQASASAAAAKSLIRMFGPRGNPQAKNLFSVIGYLQKRAGVELHVA